jgi:hypothetical protein
MSGIDQSDERDITFTDYGVHALRGVPEPLRIYRAT